MSDQLECDRPGCANVPDKTYTDGLDNELQLCNRCYYRLVSGGTVGGSVSTGPTVRTGDQLLTGGGSSQT